MKQLLLPFLLVCCAMRMVAQTPTNVTVQDDAKVGLIVTGTGNTINTTQIFGKSPEYAELKKRLENLVRDISKKADECEQMAKDNLPARYLDNCRAELNVLNAERDSVQKVETRFEEDVIRLAETFSQIELNSERLRLARKFFEEGKIKEADGVLNVRDMKTEGDALLAKKERQQKALDETESVLEGIATEFALKSVFKVGDYGDSLRYDSAIIYLEQSLRYTTDTTQKAAFLMAFSLTLREDNQFSIAIDYLEKALQLVRPRDLVLEATFLRLMALSYKDVKKMAESEKMYLHSLEIYERLAKSDSTEYEPDIALTCMLLGIFYKDVKDMANSEKMYLRSFEIYDRLAKGNPAEFEPDLALAYRHLGDFYDEVQKRAESGKMYLHSQEIYKRLAQNSPAEYELNLGYVCQNLSWICLFLQKYPEAQAAAEQTLQVDPNQNWVRSNLGHAYLLRGEWKMAKQVYEQYIAGEQDPAEAKTILAKDWDELEAAGITCPEMQKAREWLRG